MRTAVVDIKPSCRDTKYPADAFHHTDYLTNGNAHQFGFDIFDDVGQPLVTLTYAFERQANEAREHIVKAVETVISLKTS